MVALQTGIILALVAAVLHRHEQIVVAVAHGSGHAA